MNTSFNFSIHDGGEISDLFIERGIHDLEGAALYIRHLPYGRNANKRDLKTVFSDRCGTCSTKHAVLKMLATENHAEHVALVLGIFKMNAENTPPVRDVLRQHNLTYIPEAHNYLKIKGMILDCTRADSGENDFLDDLLEEIIIEPDQITDYKINYHKTYLDKWLGQQRDIHLKPDELWEVREQCIQALSA